MACKCGAEDCPSGLPDLHINLPHVGKDALVNLIKLSTTGASNPILDPGEFDELTELADALGFSMAGIDMDEFPLPAGSGFVDITAKLEEEYDDEAIHYIEDGVEEEEEVEVEDRSFVSSTRSGTHQRMASRQSHRWMILVN